MDQDRVIAGGIDWQGRSCGMDRGRSGKRHRGSSCLCDGRKLQCRWRDRLRGNWYRHDWRIQIDDRLRPNGDNLLAAGTLTLSAFQRGGKGELMPAERAGERDLLHLLESFLASWIVNNHYRRAVGGQEDIASLLGAR